MIRRTSALKKKVLRRALLCGAVAGLSGGVASAADYDWIGTGAFHLSSNWSPAGPPGVEDTAWFSRPGGPVYQVWFTSTTGSRTNANLWLTSGEYEFLNLHTSPQSYTITGATRIQSGATMHLANHTNNRLNLNTGSLVVRTGGRLNINFGSQVTAESLHLARDSGAAGTIVVNGSGSSLSVATGPWMGQNGSTANLTFSNGASGFFGNTVLMVNSTASNTKANLSVLSGSTLTAAGISAGTGGRSGQEAIITLRDDGSSITQTGSASLTLGASANSLAVLDIGTTGGTSSDQPTFTTGTGTTTVNATGQINVYNTGSFNANGNINVNGGMLKVWPGANTFNWAPSRTMTIQNGGVVSLTFSSLASNPDMPANAMINVTGAGSQWNNELSGGDMRIVNDGQVNLSAGGSALFRLFHIGTEGGNGTLTVDGAGSVLTTTGGSTLASNVGVNGGTGVATFRNGAAGAFPGGHVLYVGRRTLSGATGAHGTLNVESGATIETGGGVEISTDPSTTGIVNIQGAGSSMMQVGPVGVVVGASSGPSGAAQLNIGTLDGDGTTVFTTGTGPITVNSTGAIHIESGRLNVMGDMVLNGGTLTRGSEGIVALSGSRNMNARDGALIDFYGGGFTISGGSTVTIESGSTFSNTGRITVGTLTDGTLVVDDAHLFSGGGLWAGIWGEDSAVTLQNGAMGDVESIHLAVPDFGINTKGSLTVLSGSELTAGTISAGIGGRSGQAATIRVEGTGSKIMQTGSSELTLGASSNSTARLTVVGGTNPTFATGTGMTTLNPTGRIVVGGFGFDEGGQFIANGDLVVSGGQIFVNPHGSFSWAPGRSMTVDNGGEVFLDSLSVSEATVSVAGSGSELYADFMESRNGQINVSGGGKLGAGNGRFGRGTGTFTTVLADGEGTELSSWSGSSIQNSSVAYRNGARGVWADEGTLAVGSTLSEGGRLTVESGSSLEVGDLRIGFDAPVANVSVQGPNSSITQFDRMNRITSLTVGQSSGSAGAAQLNIGTTAGNSSTEFVTSSGGITINATGAVDIGGNSAGQGGQFRANGDVVIDGGLLMRGSAGVFSLQDGRDLTVRQGGTVHFTGDYALSSTSTYMVEGGGSFTTSGHLSIGDGTVELSGGSLRAGSITSSAGGAFNFTGGKLHVGTYTGDLINQGGALAPGQPAGNTTILGGYTQQSGAALEIEIGGTSAGGTHDLVGITGTAVLGGQLQVGLIDGFVPGAEQTFTVLNAGGGIFGVFSNVTTGQRLTIMNGPASFAVQYGPGSAFNPNQIVLSGFQLDAIPGDANLNGQVSIADLGILAANWQGTDRQWGEGDFNFDGMVSIADLGILAANWQAGAGASFSFEEALELFDVLAGVNVPEPGMAWVLGMAWAGCVRRRRVG